MPVQLSPNFYRHEFACNCGCGFDTVDAELVVVVQDIRDHFGVPVSFNSACRCPAHNAAEGGAEHSLHLYARAADVVVKGVMPSKVHEYLIAKYPDRYGIGKYRTFTHIDTRTNGPARWDFS
ncbi:D-Ala-D-Ala carboxypeptidase family metallohydrolase [Terasakiella sp.]|uniref:D-Ala-D-Ala carboxypeptidase family metallohydrolase n=1 Tax=Terasakiella sp. TaxID=2034861 RepID=UPI003AA8F342